MPALPQRIRWQLVGGVVSSIGRTRSAPAENSCSQGPQCCDRVGAASIGGLFILWRRRDRELRRAWEFDVPSNSPIPFVTTERLHKLDDGALELGVLDRKECAGKPESVTARKETGHNIG